MSFPQRFDGVILFAGAFVVRALVCLWAWDSVPPTADGAFYHVVAQRITEGLGYTWLWPDGAVTYAAHYPVGYPALMAIVYALFGPLPGAMMLFNAFLGALSVWAAHGLCRSVLFREREGRAVAFGVAGWLALSPTLVGYTPALMTEGAVATCLLGAARIVEAQVHFQDAPRRIAATAALVVILGFSVLLRPQSILFVPVLGSLSARGGALRRAGGALLVSGLCTLVVAPWTLRNCERMERCVFVSANGGWNLLIGTLSEGKGAWVALEGERVPKECREVFQEADKDSCFGRAGWDRIKGDPLGWASLAPKKLRVTMDHTAAAADHLVEAGALSQPKKAWLAIPEIVTQRGAYLFATVGAWSWANRRKHRRKWSTDRWLRLLMVGSAFGFLGVSATIGWLGILALLLFGDRGFRHVGVTVAFSAVIFTMVVHAVFFGAGRYALPLILLSAPLTALGVQTAIRRLFKSTAFGSGVRAEV